MKLLGTLILSLLAISGVALAQEEAPAPADTAPPVSVVATPEPAAPAPVSVPPESHWFGAASYDMAVPFAQAKDFGGSFSPVGFGLDVRYLLTPKWSVGLSTGWQVFDDKTTDPIQMNGGNVTIQGTQYRYLNVFPILAAGHYYLRRGANVAPGRSSSTTRVRRVGTWTRACGCWGTGRTTGATK